MPVGDGREEKVDGAFLYIFHSRRHSKVKMERSPILMRREAQPPFQASSHLIWLPTLPASHWAKVGHEITFNSDIANAIAPSKAVGFFWSPFPALKKSPGVRTPHQSKEVAYKWAGREGVSGIKREREKP